MKTFGLLPAQELAAIQFADDSTLAHNVAVIGQDRLRLDTLCPPRRFWRDHPDAPWNATIERDPAWWKAEYPEAWGGTADDDPTAPWNAESAETDPLTYFDDDGNPLYWEMPTIVPLVKLPKPTNFDPATHYAQAQAAWFADRVERGWTVLPFSAEEIAAREAKAAQSADEEQARQVYAALKNGTGTQLERLVRVERVCAAMIRRLFGA